MKTSFIIQQGTLRDVPELVHQRQLMWREIYNGKNRNIIEKSGNEYRSWLRRLLKKHEIIAFVVRREGQRKIVASGCLWLIRVQSRPMNISGKTAYLLSMYTHRKYRNQGVASSIVREAISWCQKNNYPDMVLHASSMGRSVYEKFGFYRTWEMKLELAENRLKNTSSW